MLCDNLDNVIYRDNHMITSYHDKNNDFLLSIIINFNSLLKAIKLDHLYENILQCVWVKHKFSVVVMSMTSDQ